MNAQACYIGRNRNFPGKNEKEIKTRNAVFYKRMITDLIALRNVSPLGKQILYQGQNTAPFLLPRAGIESQD